MVLKRIIIFTIIIFAQTLFANVISLDEIKSAKTLSQMLDIVDKMNKAPSKIDLDQEVNQIKSYFKLKFSLLLIKNRKIKLSENLFMTLRTIIEKSDDFDLIDEYDFDELTDIFEIEYDTWKKEKIDVNYFVSIAFYTWNYSLELTDSSGKEASLYAKERGPCIGGGLRYSNAIWGGETSLCYAYATSTIGEDSKSIKFNQNGVPVDALIWVSNLIWKPKDQVSLKFGLPVIYHEGDYTASTGGSIKDDNSFSFGYQVAGEWLYKNAGLEMSIGEFKSYPSSFWSFKLMYFFN